MALVVPYASIDLQVHVPERKSGIGLGAASESFLNHVFSYISKVENGTGANKVGAVYSAYVSSAIATTHDLRGSLLSVLDGSVVNFPIIIGMFIKNRSSTSGQYLTVGGGSNPWSTWLGTAGDEIKVGPSGFHALYSPIDGYATTAGTGDVLTVTPATGTIAYDIALIGRAS